MAANKFATMLHRNTNKITLILIYAVLEWFLIVLLLLNSLFSYLILRFADYFGLQRPCPWCSRLDHLFGSRDIHLRDLVCHRHAAEISRLRFCSSHRRLAELSDLCEDCLSSLGPGKDGGDSAPSENGELNSLKCSCCGMNLERKLLCYSPQEDHDLSCIQEQGSAADQSRSDVLLGDHPGDDQGDEEFGEFKAAESCVREEEITYEDEKVVLVMEKKEGEDFSAFEVEKDSSISNRTVFLKDDSRKEESARASSGCHLEFFIGGNDCELIPVEWTDSISVRSYPRPSPRYPRLSPIMEEEQGNCGAFEDVIMDFCPPPRKPDLGMGYTSSGNISEVSHSVEQAEILENVSEEAHGNSTQERDGQVPAAPNGDENEERLFPEGERGNPNDDQAAEEESASQIDEVEEEVSIGTEIPDQTIDVDEIHDKETTSLDPCTEGDRIISNTLDYNDRDTGRSEGDTLEFRTNSIEMSIKAPNHQLDLSEWETLEFRTNSIETSKDTRNHQLYLSEGDSLEFGTNSIEMSKESPNYQLDLYGEGAEHSSTSHDSSQSTDIDTGGADIARDEEEILEFRTNSIEMSKEALNQQLDLCGEGAEYPSTSHDIPRSADIDTGGTDIARDEEETLEFRTNSIEMSKEALNQQLDLCEEGVEDSFTNHDVPQSADFDTGGVDIARDEEENLEFRTNLIEMSKESLNQELDLCGKGVEDSSTSHDIPESADSDTGGAVIAQKEEENMELRTISIEMSTDASNHQLDEELKENEDERIPDTPNSMDSLHQLHRRLLLLEKRDSGSTEESLDESVMSDIECDEGSLTVEKLKSALKAERKALHAVYTELEEERSASAVAASQTMAMINRLQEEKAAMQMEALQYQRMMEEQSEYDQEALQLLNDLMVKREREKEELEKELEVYRRKVEEYEAKEKNAALMVVSRNSKDSSDLCCNQEESDGLSIDLNEEAAGEDHINGHGYTPSEAVLSLEDSLINFEEERASILKQLKNLEEKILNVNGEEEAEKWHYKENGNGHVKTCDLNGEVNGSDNGHCKMNDNNHFYRQARLAAPKAKRLLPLFDAIREEMDEDWLQKTPPDHLEVGDEKIAIIEEEVDHIYERLQVLEADREFLKHCVGSLRKGDKGLELLGEILQHLRDLRCAELHGQNIIIGDGIMQY